MISNVEIENGISDLKTTTVKSSAIAFSSKAIILILNLVTTAALARILMPRDYGLLGMVLVVTGFLEIFKDMGLSLVTVQKRIISNDQINFLFWTNVLVGIILFVFTILLAPVISHIYQEERLSNIASVVGVSFIINGLSIQHLALLRRYMKFNFIAVIEITSFIFSAILAILVAWAGWNYWALVIQQLSRMILILIGAWSFCTWRPQLRLQWSDVKNLISFGGALSLNSFLNYNARNLDKLLIGIKWGAQNLGLYTKAYQLLLLPINTINNPITNVVISGLSRLQKEPTRFRNYYLQALSITAFMTMPLSIMLLILSEDIIYIILGPKWSEAIPIFRFLTISAVVQPICNTTGWIYVSLRKSRNMLIWSSIYLFFIFISFIIGLPWGAEGVALVYSIAMIIQFLPAMAFAIKDTKINMRDILNSVRQIFISACVTGILIYLLKLYLLSDVNIFLSVIISIMLMVLIYLYFMLYLFDNKSYYISLYDSLIKK